MELHLHWETGASTGTDGKTLFIPFPYTPSSWFRVGQREAWPRMLGLIAPREINSFVTMRSFCHIFILIFLVIMRLCVSDEYMHMSAGAPGSKRHQFPLSWICSVWELRTQLQASGTAASTLPKSIEPTESLIQLETHVWSFALC